MRIAMPNGSLFEPCQKLLAKAGIKTDFVGRKLITTLNHQLIQEVVLHRPQHIPELVAQGFADCGLCGYDCLVESGLQDKLQILTDFDFAKKSKKSAQLIIFGQTNVLRDGEDVIVAAEYPNIARANFQRATIKFSYGATEASVLLGLATYGLGVFESGDTLIANGLKKVKELFKSPVVLIARQSSDQLRELKSRLKKYD